MKANPRNRKEKAYTLENKQYLEYIENIIESLDESIVVFDSQGKIVLCNLKMREKNTENKDLPVSFRELFPCFWEEYRGKIWGEIFMQDVLGKGEKRILPRFPLGTSEHRIRYSDLKGIPIQKQGKILGAILILSDVTENINLQERLIRQARTSSLANLGASIAHEIRNPLNSISLHIQLVKEWLQNPAESSHEEMVESLDNVLYEINRMNELIRYFLRFSRPPEPQFDSQDPNLAVRQAIRLLEEDARHADVEILLQLQPLPEIMIDRNQIAQAVYNIALNAVQALKLQGGGKLEINTLKRKEYVLIEIKDNGPGLSPQAREKLFELFFTTKEDGSGLGLPISNQIVERHDGKIVAENNLDRGACFSIYLPIPALRPDASF